MYGKVTVALDGSRLAESALAPAAELARRHGARMRVISVGAGPSDEVHLKDYHAALYEDRVLDDASLCEVLSDPGLGTAAVLHEAVEGPQDLLCMATRGHGFVASAVLGSVAEGVLARHPHPVFLVGPAYDPQRPVSFETLLLCLDGSEQSEAMVPHAAAWAEQLGMTIRILHVTPPPPAADAEIPPGREHDAEERRQHGEETLGAYLSTQAARLSCGDVRATWQVLVSDNPAAAICAAAAEAPGAIVALATRGYDDLRRLTLGSVAMSVAHDSPVPVLVVRASGASPRGSQDPAGAGDAEPSDVVSARDPVRNSTEWLRLHFAQEDEAYLSLSGLEPPSPAGSPRSVRLALPGIRPKADH